MSVWLEIPRCHSNGRHKASGRTTMRSNFEISRKFFPEFRCIWKVLPCRLDSRTLAAHNFHIKAWRVRTMTSVVWTVNLIHVIIWSSRSQTMKTVVQTSDFWMRYLLCGWARPDRNPHRSNGNPHRLDGCSCLPISVFFKKKSHSWSNTKWRPSVLLKRSDECKLEQFEASRHRGRSGRKFLVVWIDDAWDSLAQLHISRGNERVGSTRVKQDAGYTTK